MLQTLGMGLGLAAVDVDHAGSLKAVGIGTGIWSIIASLIAMFIGAFVVGRLSGTLDQRVGATHGGVMWGLATAVGLWAMLSILGAMANGVAVGGGVVVSGAAPTAGKLEVGDTMSTLGIETNDLIAPINERLQHEGKPSITTVQLNRTVRAIAKRGLSHGKVDHEVLVDELATNTALSRADAEDIATKHHARYEELANRVSQMGEKMREGAKTAAQEAVDKTGKALLLGGVMMLLSLGTALAGGALGARSTARRDPYLRTPTTGATIVTPPVESTTIVSGTTES